MFWGFLSGRVGIACVSVAVKLAQLSVCGGRGEVRVSRVLRKGSIK